MEDVLSPIVLFVAIALVFWAMFYFRFRSRAEFQQTIRLALEKGNELSPELIDRLGEPEPNKDRDLRRGLVWLALGVGTAALAFGIPDREPDALSVLLAVSAFPVSIGIAFMIMWRYGVGQKEKS